MSKSEKCFATFFTVFVSAVLGGLVILSNTGPRANVRGPDEPIPPTHIVEAIIVDGNAWRSAAESNKLQLCERVAALTKRYPVQFYYDSLNAIYTNRGGRLGVSISDAIELAWISTDNLSPKSGPHFAANAA
jgi:hypothetical protein